MTAPIRQRPAARTMALTALLTAAFVLLMTLGVWQFQRRVWKLDLIARVSQRLHAAPVSAPGPAAWPRIDAAHDAYRRVWARGLLLNDRETLVQAVTERGGGFWVMTPLRTDAGFTVLVDRGFVDPDHAAPLARRESPAAGETRIDGLLRVSEPRGGFLRNNDPAHGRWYSRDVAAITAAHGLTATAPYFVDADARANRGGWPVGGLTVVAFPNSHLVYALTWFALAGLLAGGAGWRVREALRRRPR